MAKEAAESKAEDKKITDAGVKNEQGNTALFQASFSLLRSRYRCTTYYIKHFTSISSTQQ